MTKEDNNKFDRPMDGVYIGPIWILYTRLVLPCQTGRIINEQMDLIEIEKHKLKTDQLIYVIC